MNIIKFIQMTISTYMKERYKMFFLTGFLIVLIDQIVKMIVTAHIPYGTTLGSCIRITNVANTGMAYSMRTKQSNIYSYCKCFNCVYIINFSNKKL